MKRIQVFFCCAGALIVGFAVACTDSGADDLVAFQGSECKKESVSGFRSPMLFSRQEEPGLQGLQCLSWQTAADGEMDFDLLNFVGACGAQWEGRAKVADENRVELTVINPDCLIASCGSCIYDWSFTVTNIVPTTDLSVEIKKDTCPGEQEPEFDNATLQNASLLQGTLCRYVPWGALEWHVMSTGESGLLHMPCSDGGETETDELDLSTCGPDMVCESLSPNPREKICLAQCDEDTDCPLPDLQTCQDGRCLLTSEWI